MPNLHQPQAPERSWSLSQPLRSLPSLILCLLWRSGTGEVAADPSPQQQQQPTTAFPRCSAPWGFLSDLEGPGLKLNCPSPALPLTSTPFPPNPPPGSQAEWGKPALACPGCTRHWEVDGYRGKLRLRRGRDGTGPRWRKGCDGQGSAKGREGPHRRSLGAVAKDTFRAGASEEKLGQPQEVVGTGAHL